MTTQRQALKAIELAARREVRAMARQASAATERAKCLDALASAYAAASPLSPDNLGAGFLVRARLARAEAAIARSQSGVHDREVHRAKAEIGAVLARASAELTRQARRLPVTAP